MSYVGLNGARSLADGFPGIYIYTQGSFAEIQGSFGIYIEGSFALNGARLLADRFPGIYIYTQGSLAEIQGSFGIYTEGSLLSMEPASKLIEFRVFTYIYRALWRKYRALLWMYKALLVCTYRDLSLPKQRVDFCVLICIHRALLRIYRALLQIYRALLRMYRALLRMYRALMVCIYRALSLPIERAR